MNIPSHTLIEAGAHNQEAHKILDKGMMIDSFANYEQEIPERQAFVAEQQPDAIAAGIDAVKVTEEEAASRRFVTTKCYFGGTYIEEKTCIAQGAGMEQAVLDAQTVLYFRRCARQLIHDGTYTGAVNCWTMCMGEGPHPTKVALNNALFGRSWKQVSEALTQEESQESYKQVQSNNRKLKQNRL